MKKLFLALLIGLSLISSIHLAMASSIILNPVKFVYQLGDGSWKDPRLAQGCEEAAVLMAVEYGQGRNFSADEARLQIIALSEYENQQNGSYVDTSAADTAKLMKEVYGQDYNLRYDISIDDIMSSLAAGNIVIVPVNGRILNNPHYTKPGPEHHTIVIIGYDPAKKQFIVNDPGVHSGAGMRFAQNVVQNALQDYPSGNHLKVTVIRTAMIEVPKSASMNP